MADTQFVEDTPHSSAAKIQGTFHRAVKWAYVMNWGEKGFSALFTFVLASILGPGEFGIVAMAMIYIAFIQMFLEQGLVAALVQRKDLTDDHVHSVFWANMTLSFVLLAASVACSGWWARLNHVPSLYRFVCVLTLAIPLEGLSIVPRAILQRNMDFKSLSIRSNASVLAGGVIGLGMAFRGCGAWSLVGQRLGQDAITVVLLWNLSHWRPKFRVSFRCLKELFKFSSANFLAKLSIFANIYCGALVLGIFMGPVAVGIFRLAQRLMGIVLDVTSTALQTVSLPQFSRVQDDPAALRQSMLSFIRFSSTVALPLMAGVAVTSTPLMRLLGPKWLPASDVIKLLSVCAMILAYAQFIGPLLQGVSKPLYAAMVTWGSTIVSVGLLVGAAMMLRHSSVQRQVVGIAAVQLLADALVMIPVLIFVLQRFVHINLREFFAVIYPSAAAGAAVAGVVALFAATGMVNGMRPALELACEFVLGAVAGLVTLYWLDRKNFNSLIAPIRNRFTKPSNESKAVLES